MGLIDAIINSQPHGGTALGAAIRHTPPSSRLIVITDEQSRDQVPNPRGRGYMINVATYQHGVGYGPWIHIDGFSESVLSFMAEIERPSEARD
jgi:translation elongation factor EF-Tu-like GTPase